MKKLLSFLFIALLMIFSVAGVTSAVEFKVGNDVSLDGQGPINDDIYVAAGTVNVLQNIYGDLIVGGGMVTLDADVTGDVIVAGGKVIINGHIGDDLRIIGAGQVEINGSINDDLLIIGGVGNLDKKAYVGGDVVLLGGMFELRGYVDGGIEGTAGKLSIFGRVGRNVDVTLKTDLNVSPQAQIFGNLKYKAPTEAKIEKRSVRGKIEFNKFEIKSPFSKESLKNMLTLAFLSYKIFVILAYAILALLIILLAPNFTTRISEIARKNFWKSLGVGLLTSIALIAIALIALVSGIGVYVGILAIALSLILFLISQVMVGLIIGSFFFKKKAKVSKARLFLSYLVGLIIYSIVVLIPIIGWIIALIVYLVAVGSYMLGKNEMALVLREKKLL